MNKKHLITLSTFILIVVICFTITRKSDIQKAQEKYSKAFKEHPFNKTLALTKKERKANGIPPNKYFEEKYLLEMNPYTGRTHPENLYKLQQDLKETKLSRKAPGDSFSTKWEERGPNNVGGRTRVVLFDPNDATHKRVFAGGVSGGLWVNEDITDANSSWTQVGIDVNLAISCMTVDPNNPQIMYVGTGELYTGNQALGNGVWRSIDGGATWVNVYIERGGISGNSVLGTYYTTDIIVRDADGSSSTPNDSEVFVAVGASYYANSPQSTFVGTANFGVFKSIDTGENWNRLTLNSTNGSPEAVNDFEIGANNTLWLSTTKNIYGQVGGKIYNSLDGNTFTLKHTVPNGKRTEIAVSKTDANKIYILAELTTDPVGIYVTTDGFATAPSTLALPDDADTEIPTNDFTRGQAFYNLLLAVDPTNDDTVYVGGIDLFRTTNSGTAWTQISKWSNNNNLRNLSIPTVHADQHGWAFHPTDANIAVNGNDGGVFYASSLSAAASSTSAISSRNKNYNVTQFYKAAIGQSDSPQYLLAGAQDNGTQLINGASSGVNSTVEVFGGDGGYCFIDKDGAYMVASYVYNVVIRLDLPYSNGGSYIASDLSTGSFINAMDLDDNLEILYTNGTNQLSRFSEITTIAVRTNITNELLTDISTIKVSPYTTTSSKVFVGTIDGNLIKVADANTGTPTFTDISGDSFLGSISSIEFGATEDEILVTFHNFGVTSVWYSSNGGTSWASKEGDLPDIPVKCVLRNPLNGDEVILGTELGVWKTSNFNVASPTWSQSNSGMSDVPVTSFDLKTADNTILASTYGRGMFTSNFKLKWVGATSSDWDTSLNWENSVLPDASDNVLISAGAINYPTASSAVTVSSITIESGASFIAQSTVSGKVTYIRNLPTDNWYLAASPVVGETALDFLQGHRLAMSTTTSGAAQKVGLASYDTSQTGGAWNYYVAGDYDDLNGDDTLDSMIAGQGFSMKLASPGNISFTGVMNTENESKNISTSAAGNAYNLVGNPYPSYLNATTFLSTNALNSTHIEGSIWVWNQATNNYDAKNLASEFKIAPAQGFFVKNVSGTSILFEEVSQSHETGDTFQKNTTPGIKLLLSDGTNSKYTQIFYINGTTTGFDNGYDSELFGGVTTNFSIYSHLLSENVDKKYQIQSLPNLKEEAMIIPIGLEVESGIEISFSAEILNLPVGLKVFLEDRLTNTFTQLDAAGSMYTVALRESINEIGRFYLHTSSASLNVQDLDATTISVYSSNKKIYFSGLPSRKLKVTVYDVLGKIVLEKNITETTKSISTGKLPAGGVYIVSFSSEKGKINKKIIIQ